MSRASLAAGAAALCLVVRAAAGQPEEPFPPKGEYNNSVHRSFPDLDARLNAVRYGRWRALEIAWISGIDAASDGEFFSYFLRLVSKPPRFDPEASRVALHLAREATPVFRALRWGQVLEAQVLDILASPDSSLSRTSQRMARLLTIYRRERWALNTSPPETSAPSSAIAAAPSSARMLLAGARLFALAAEDLAAADFGQQRWRVKKTLEAYDYAPSADVPLETATYRVSAPTVESRFPEIVGELDLVARLRRDLFSALVSRPETPPGRRDRDSRVRELARRWGLPAEGIGGR
jgi:hypothetical protein